MVQVPYLNRNQEPYIILPSPPKQNTTKHQYNPHPYHKINLSLPPRQTKNREARSIPKNRGRAFSPKAPLRLFHTRERVKLKRRIRNPLSTFISFIWSKESLDSSELRSRIE
ncbi:hypothetical protein P691DRAFT_431307 [Macrolepiota fuliginosa MF-IS2]|uniref:Uncharacterized protein n=1 Tax=Macrolepiota fuliginosa MF-IS2 TaxID=1400762 RepID=A0A9P5X5B5_9AGAR|nr:hypothetical protein P691DRAFT_431307 [Macrolepiota fuliginosa MF-IS2]